jgi:hypothetical protein
MHQKHPERVHVPVDDEYEPAEHAVQTEAPVAREWLSAKHWLIMMSSEGLR